MMSKKSRFFLATSTILAVLLASNLVANADQGFQNFIAKFQSTATKNGISAQTYNAAFAGITDIDPVVLEKAHFQPEFKSPMWDYIDNRVQEKSVATGRAMAKKYKAWLDKIEATFGVDRNILLAIWSMETNYGEILTRPDVVRSVTRSLATLAYADKPRAKYARSQLIAALKILQRGDTDAAGLQGSWAGAMGQTQFIQPAICSTALTWMAMATAIFGHQCLTRWQHPQTCFTRMAGSQATLGAMRSLYRPVSKPVAQNLWMHGPPAAYAAPMASHFAMAVMPHH